MDRKFIMAWDSSNSKTQVKLQTIETVTNHEFVLGTIRPDSEIPEQVEALLESLTRELTAIDLKLSDCTVLCAGLSSFHRPDLGDELRHVLDQRGFKGLLKLTGDFEIALWGALGQIPDENGMIQGGAVLISGKGSICFGQSPAGKRQRTGGYGPLLDDAGSGFSIGRDILAAIVKSSDKRQAATALTDLVFERLEIKSVGELMLLVNTPGYQLYHHAFLAPALDVAIDQNDAAANVIVEKTAADLMELVKPVINGLGLNKADLGLAGGILLNCKSVRDKTLSLLQAAYPELNVYSARKTAVEAALEYAKKHA